MAELLRVPPTRAFARWWSPQSGSSHPSGGPHRGDHTGEATTGKVRNGGFMLGKWNMTYFFLEDVGYYVRIFLEENVK